MLEALSNPGASTFQQLLDMGGPVMAVLMALAVIGLVTVFYLMLSGALFAPRRTRSIERTIQGWQRQPGENWPRDLNSASRLARLNPLRGLCRTAMTGCLDRQDAGALREELARNAQRALQPFEAPLKVVEVIAALAPLLGLLGTVMGMMEAFNVMSQSEGRASATQLSGGIYEALVTTAAGLVLAIPFAAVAAWVEFRLRRLNTLINDSLVRIINTRLPEAALSEAEPTAASAGPRRQEPLETRAATAHAAG